MEKIELEKKIKAVIDKIDDQQSILIKMFKDKENVMMENDNCNL